MLIRPAFSGCEVSSNKRPIQNLSVSPFPPCLAPQAPPSRENPYPYRDRMAPLLGDNTGCLGPCNEVGLAWRNAEEYGGGMKLNERTRCAQKPGTMPEGARRAAEAVRRVEIPFMGSAVMAGFPSPAEQYVERPLDLNELLVARPAATYFVRAEGDSMEGVGIRSGDMLVVDRSLPPWDRAVVIACVDGEFTVKTFRKGRGGVRLEAANPAYKPIRFKDEMELRVFGVVTAVIHRFHGEGEQASA